MGMDLLTVAATRHIARAFFVNRRSLATSSFMLIIGPTEGRQGVEVIGFGQGIRKRRDIQEEYNRSAGRVERLRCAFKYYGCYPSRFHLLSRLQGSASALVARPSYTDS